MERTYETAAAFAGRAGGPLANHVGPFVASLVGGHRIESTVRYLGVEVDDALAIAEQIDV